MREKRQNTPEKKGGAGHRPSRFADLPQIAL
jgi:hypothetical protein